ncbi:hemagglutinin repeat-containing protein [Herbaspirillum sp. WKF16]|uniref:two-partner secretion domain-containing protein n=1 Tax=Herbaspirillum sp. WKF16 TaxID=3028312 RepID=UPI0023A9E10E|nr:hemagglutinin repeat-containing protein [Herbaspirillum sp. WKF16]WDZ96563.1 hemagglutinin repeat-containing protein [Herbaspirillum sp. WKF16]
MNGQSHRVAFNSAFGHLRMTRLAMHFVLLGSSVLGARAQIVAAPSGPHRPVIDSTANGRALVQIVAPNAAGVSHNQYQQFNIGRGGALLNNATGNTLTQQGGWVGANPSLGGKPARLIVNEVNSTNPSQLRGYLEVAGQRADVVVSNPNGILVDGFGFINASRGTLTTGTPVFGSGGALEALRVTQGSIAVGGEGFNDSGTAQVDLIARSVQLNAALWADRANVITGANRVDYANLGVQVIAGAGGAPTVALDVAAIGGMYANRIRLIGTEAGVGVRSYGKMASAGEFEIDSAGKVTLHGPTSAAAAMRIGSGEAIVNRATLSSGAAMALQAGVIDNAGGKILSGGDLALAAGALGNTAGEIRSNRNASLGLRSDFSHAQGDAIGAAGDLAIATTGDFSNQGELAAGGNVSVRAANIVNRKDGLLFAGQTTLLQAEQGIVNTGRIYGEDVAIAARSVTNDHEGVYGDNVPAGVIAARNSLNIGAANIVNREHALIKSDGDIAIGGALDGNGKAVGKAASVTNSSAAIDAGGKLTIASAALLNANAHFASELQLDPSKTRSWTEYEIDGYSHVYAADAVYLEPDGSVMQLVVRDTGGRFNHYTIREITETTRSTVVTASDPGKIVSRGDMLFSGGTVTNDKSAIVAGGALNGTIDGASNGGTNPQGEIHVHRDVVSIHRTTKSCAGGTRTCNKDSISYPSYDLPVTHFDLGIWKAQAHTTPDSRANPAAGQAPQVALLASSQLYRPGTAPGSTHYIETDPAFVNYRLFLSSDYQLGRLAMDPQRAQKRLGDGYYEQQLVNDQILRLTGRKQLGAYASDEDQYRALMDAGVTYGQRFGLAPGIALSAAQMAQLTSDLVWLVEQDVSLPDGSTQKALVPKVYLSRLREQDLKPTGALIAADSIDLRINGSLANAGTLRANTTLAIAASQDIDNTLGTMASDAGAGTTTLRTGRDFNNRSGTISGNRVAIVAGRDANIGTIANTSQSVHGTQVALERSGGVDAGTLWLQAQRDINLNAAAVNTTGDAALTAGNNLNLNAVKTQEELKVTYDDRNHLYKKQEQANGTTMRSGGNTALAAGNDLNAQAAYVNSDKAITATAGGNISIGAAAQAGSYDQEVYISSSGPLTSSSMHSKDKQTGTQAIGSTFSGNTVAISSGRDTGITGSNIISTNNTTISAGRNIKIEAAEETQRQDLLVIEKQSGVLSGGGLGVTIGSRSKTDRLHTEQVQMRGSTIGSFAGDVSLNAAKSLAVEASDVVAGRNAMLSGANVAITSGTNTFNHEEEHRLKQSGITLALKSAIVDTAMSVGQSIQRRNEVQDPRLKKLLALKAISTLDTNYESMEQEAKAIQKGDMGSVSLQISVGASSSESKSIMFTRQAKGSALYAGERIAVLATGDGLAPGNIDVTGSSAHARSIDFSASGSVSLQSAYSTMVSDTSNNSGGWNAGVGISLGRQTGLTFSANGYRGKGKTNGQSVSQVNTIVDGTQSVRVTSGGDTSIRGAIVSGRRIDTEVGRNLIIESKQDTETYRGKQNSTSAGASFIYGAGGSANINHQQSRTDADYASVISQSGLKAGDGGFGISVTGQTELIGGLISSDAERSKNQLQTGNLKASSIINNKSLRSETKGYSAGTGSASMYGAMKETARHLATAASENSSDSSSTYAMISPAQVVVRDGDRSALTAIKSDAGSAHRALSKDDPAAADRRVQEKAEAANVIFDMTEKFVEENLAKMANPKLYTVFCRKQPCTNDQVENSRRVNEYAEALKKSNPDLSDEAAFQQSVAKLLNSEFDPNRVVKIQGKDGREMEVGNIASIPTTLAELSKLSDEEKKNSSLFANGIFNDKDRGAQLALQMAPTQKDISVITGTGETTLGQTYLVHTKQGGILGEYFIAAAEKLAEITGIATPASKLTALVAKELSSSRDNNGNLVKEVESGAIKTNTPITVGGHSRGSMTLVNAMRELKGEGFFSDFLQVNAFNPAAEERRLKENIAAVSSRPPYIWAPENDPIATMIGGYRGKLSLSDVSDMYRTRFSVHSCGGAASVGCKNENVDSKKLFSYQGLDIEELNIRRSSNIEKLEQRLQQQATPILPSTDWNAQQQQQAQENWQQQKKAQTENLLRLKQLRDSIFEGKR